MKIDTINRLTAAYLPLLLFLPSYEIYYHLIYYGDRYEPEEYKNWGYILLGIFFLIRSASLGFIKKENGYKALLRTRLLVYHFAFLVATLILTLNIMGIIMLLQPRFIEIMTLFLLSFIATRIFLAHLYSDSLLKDQV